MTRNVFDSRLRRRCGAAMAGAVLLLGAAPSSAQDAPTPAPAQSQQEAAAKQDSATLDFFRRTEVSGFVDAYYTYNFNTPAKACATVGGVAVFNCLYNFNVAHNSFSLNLAEVALEKKPGADSRGGFRIDLDYGSATDIVHAFEPGGTTVYHNIEQAYLSYLAPAGTGLQIDFGKFVTPMGNEVIETKDNWNYSRSLLFALAIPYYHMGMRATYSPNEKVALAGYLVNGWNDVVDNNTGKSLGASVTFKPTGTVTLIENYMGGPEQPGTNAGWRHASDTILSYAVNKQTSVAVNYDYGHDGGLTSPGGSSGVKWQGVAGYLKYQANDWFAVVPRYEYLNDTDGFMTGVTQDKLQEFTLTTEFKHKDGVVMRVEYRGDFSDVPYYPKNAEGMVKSQHTLTVGLVYAFTTKAP